MKKALTATFAAIALTIGGVTILPSIAHAEVCVPMDAYIQTITHEAVGEETIENPNYIPATEGYWVVEPKLYKWTWTGGPVESAPLPPTVDSNGWNEVGYTNDKKGRDNPDTVIQAGKGNADFFFYQTVRTRIEGTDAVGEPTIENPDYIPARTEEISHDAVVCEVPIPEKPQSITGDEQRTSAPVCVTPLNGTTTSTLETRLWTQDHIWDEASWSWVSDKRSFQDWIIADTIISDSAACADTSIPWTPLEPSTPVIVDIPAIPLTPATPKLESPIVTTNIVDTVDHITESPVLAVTGGDIAPWAILGVSLTVLGLGIIIPRNVSRKKKHV